MSRDARPQPCHRRRTTSWRPERSLTKSSIGSPSTAAREGQLGQLDALLYSFDQTTGRINLLDWLITAIDTGYLDVPSVSAEHGPRRAAL